MTIKTMKRIVAFFDFKQKDAELMRGSWIENVNTSWSCVPKSIVGYDGEHTVIRCKGIAIAVLCEVGNVSCL